MLTSFPPVTSSDGDPAKDERIDHAKASSVEAQKIASLEARIVALEGQIADIKAQEAEISAKLKFSHPASTTVQTHISLLHTYNEIRDIASGLMGIIADNRGVRARDIYEEYGVHEAS
ncbi:hypothetical protein MMC31_007977 [Peltigera leucophlebia]|nr:hypothetical protein [Peltigera leucophlebia]